jgi:hypothetical protein
MGYISTCLLKAELQARYQHSVVTRALCKGYTSPASSLFLLYEHIGLDAGNLWNAAQLARAPHSARYWRKCLVFGRHDDATPRLSGNLPPFTCRLATNCLYSA